MSFPPRWRVGISGGRTCLEETGFRCRRRGVSAEAKISGDTTGGFAKGHTTIHVRPLDRGRMDDTVNGPPDGKSEGWSAVMPEVVQ